MSKNYNPLLSFLGFGNDIGYLADEIYRLSPPSITYSLFSGS